MVTIILTYRNREKAILKNCLDSLQNQNNKDFEVILVNYGSQVKASNFLVELVDQYKFVSVINCSTQGQLWCKSKAINIALKNVKTPYVLIGDIDMIFHPDFISKLNEFKEKGTATYFQVGFLSKEESANSKLFNEYNIKFRSSHEATGMTFFHKDDLMSVNGYDEFYHGWGSEDTDVHARLKNSGKKVNFFDSEVFILHQWHPKHYRFKNSSEPFHSYLEQINQSYLDFTKQSKKTKANLNFGFGIYQESDYEDLKNHDLEFSCSNNRDQIKGFIYNVLMNKGKGVIKLIINEDAMYKSSKEFFKKVLGKKTSSFLSMQQTNDLLLEIIVTNLRNCPYNYRFDQENKRIDLTIKLQGI